MGRQILLPTTALNSSTSSTLNSDTINAIPSFSSNNLNFNPDPNLEDPVIYEEKIEVDVEVQDKLDLLIDEAKTWNAKDTFIQHVVMRVYYIVPAFIVGLMVGVFLWALYILLYKTRTRYFPSTTTTTTASENDCTEMKRSNQNSFEDVSSQATDQIISTLGSSSSAMSSKASSETELHIQGKKFIVTKLQQKSE